MGWPLSSRRMIVCSRLVARRNGEARRGIDRHRAVLRLRRRARRRRRLGRRRGRRLNGLGRGRALGLASCAGLCGGAVAGGSVTATVAATRGRKSMDRRRGTVAECPRPQDHFERSSHRPPRTHRPHARRRDHADLAEQRRAASHAVQPPAVPRARRAVRSHRPQRGRASPGRAPLRKEMGDSLRTRSACVISRSASKSAGSTTRYTCGSCTCRASASPSRSPST